MVAAFVHVQKTPNHRHAELRSNHFQFEPTGQDQLHQTKFDVDTLCMMISPFTYLSIMICYE